MSIGKEYKINDKHRIKEKSKLMAVEKRRKRW